MLHRYRIAFLFLLGAALLLTTGFVSSGLNWWQRDLLFAAGVACTVASHVLYFNVKLNKLDKAWQLRMPQFNLLALQVPECMQDDLEDIREGRLTGTQFSVFATIGGALLFFFYLLLYHKVGAQWYGFNVFMIALIVSVSMGFLIARTEWFQDQDFRTPMWVFMIPVIALVLCVGLGVFMTEPMELGGPTAYQSATSQTTQTSEYDYSRTRAHYYYYNWGSGSSTSASSSGSGSSFHCSGKGCGYAVLLVLLIILVLVLIVCSALVAHFWVLAGMLLLTIMLMIAIHELRVMDYRRSW